MRALTLERWVPDPGPDTADPSSGAIDTEEVPYAFTWTDTGDPADMEAYAFVWDDKDYKGDTAGLNGKDIAAGAGTGAAVGGVVGTIFPGIGNAVGAGVGSAVGAIGGFFSGMFGGKRKRRKKKKKPTPKWVVEVLEDARRGLLEVPTNPSKSIDAVLVVSGQMTRQGYAEAKQAGQLPSQKYDRDRSAVLAKGAQFQKKLGRRIAKHLKGLNPAERALVSAAIPLGSSGPVLGALQKIRSTVSSAHTDPARPSMFTPEALQQLAPELAEPGPTPPERIEEPADAEGEEELAPEHVAVPWRDSDPGADDTSGPTGVARAPTLDDLPQPVWHVSPPVMPRHVFARLLHAVPELRKLPKNMLRGIAGRGPRAQDTAGVDPVMRQYLMLPGETFAGIARNLTGDPDRAVELYAANPNHNPARMRVDIPPGWLEFTPLLMRDDDNGNDNGLLRGTAATDAGSPGSPGKAAPAPKVKQAGKKDAPRRSTTRRVIAVQAGDWPEKIASRTGAKRSDPQWWRTLKSANPHKVVASNGNWQTLFPNEVLNYPDTWPQHVEAKQAQGAPEGPVTSPGALDPADPLGPEPDLKDVPPPPPPKRTGKDGARPSMTRRVIEVMVNDWPEKIAIRTGAKGADPLWWTTLKSVNPHKVVASNGNWQTLFAGEHLNYPDTWPAHAEAKQVHDFPTEPLPPLPRGPLPPPSPIPGGPGPSPGIPSGGTAEHATTAYAQNILFQWARKNPDVSNPPDFGKDYFADVNGTMTERTRSCLKSFQVWWNTRSLSSQIRTDGVLGDETVKALTTYQTEILPGMPPGNPIPGGGGSPLPGGGGSPLPGGGGSPLPGGGGSPLPGGGGSPLPGGGGSPAPYPPPAAPQSARQDNDAAVLVIGGTMLSLLLK